MGLATNRNRTEFEHGFLPVPPKAEQVRDAVEHAVKVVATAYPQLRERLERLQFPQLG
jgi:hypothetical protein